MVPCLVCGREPRTLLVPEFEAVTEVETAGARRGGVGPLGELAGAGGRLSWRIEEMEAVSRACVVVDGWETALRTEGRGIGGVEEIGTSLDIVIFVVVDNNGNEENEHYINVARDAGYGRRMRATTRKSTGDEGRGEDGRLRDREGPPSRRRSRTRWAGRS